MHTPMLRLYFIVHCDDIWLSNPLSETSDWCVFICKYMYNVQVVESKQMVIYTVWQSLRPQTACFRIASSKETRTRKFCAMLNLIIVTASEGNLTMKYPMAKEAAIYGWFSYELDTTIKHTMMVFLWQKASLGCDKNIITTQFFSGIPQVTSQNLICFEWHAVCLGIPKCVLWDTLNQVLLLWSIILDLGSLPCI